MPRKQWGVFEKLNAGDVNSFLADQSVMVFATTAARDAALPSPTVGMQSAVQASPDLGAPRYWNGSTWVLVQNGSPIGQVLALGDQSLQASIRIGDITNPISLAELTWSQITASFGTDVIVHGVAAGFVSAAEAATWEIATGAAGSEVVRYAWRGEDNNVQRDPYISIPYGIGVPNGTRLAFRWTKWAGGTSPKNIIASIYYTPIATAPDLQRAGLTTAVQANGTSWVEMSTGAPIFPGVWITELSGASQDIIGGGNVKFQLGMGASGSESPVTGYMNNSKNSGGFNQFHGRSLMSPVWWPTGSRLAFRTDTASATTVQYQASVAWRETLT